MANYTGAATNAVLIVAPVSFIPINKTTPSGVVEPADVVIIKPEDVELMEFGSNANNTILSGFQQLDFLVLQGITGASVYKGIHSMCNGANFAYDKNVFYEVKGFEGIDDIASGDDMLLMQKIWKRNKNDVRYLKSRKAIVSTNPMQTWKDFINQRKRWASKSAYYTDPVLKLILIFVYLFNVLFFVLLTAACLNEAQWSLVIYYLLGKMVIELPFFVSIAGFYNNKKLVPYFLLLQPLHILYTVFVGFISQFGRYEWKNRRTK